MPSPPTEAGGRYLLPALLLFLLLFPSSGARAQSPAPKTVVLLASDLTWDDLRPNGDLLPLRRLASEGGCALLNATVAGEPTEAAAFLTVGAGARVAAPGERGPRIFVDEVPLTVADVAQEAYPANAWEGNAVRPVYVRRFGVPAPADAVGVDIGLPLLRRAQAGPASAAQIGALGDALRQAGRRVAAFGDWRATAAGMDRRGAVYHGSAVTDLTPARLPAALEEADVVIAAAGTGRRPLRLLCEALLPLVSRGAVNLVVACPAPPLDAALGRWQRLGFVVGAGPAFRPRSLLTSATTRTGGLAANVDLAPTILALQGLPPFPGGTGHALRAVPPGRAAALDAVTRLDAQVVTAEDASVPVLAGYAAFAVASGIAGLALCLLAARRGGDVPGAGAAALALRLAAAGPLAFLPAGLLAPGHVWQYGGVFAAFALIFALAADLLGGWLDVSPLGLLLLTTAAAVAADALLGSPVVSRALPSGYYLPGLRFYGVGNEYMALTVGAALAGAALLSPRALAPVGVAVALALGLPWFGANAGGALAAAAAFLVAVWGLRPGGTRAWHVAAAFGAGFAVVAVCVAADRLLPLGAPTHLGGVPDLRGGGGGALGEMVVRKLARSAHVARAGWTLAALAGAAPLGLGLLLLLRGPLRERAERALMREYVLARALSAALWGALAALLFTDSGVAAALLLLAPPVVAFVHQMLDQ